MWAASEGRLPSWCWHGCQQRLGLYDSNISQLKSESNIRPGQTVFVFTSTSFFLLPGCTVAWCWPIGCEQKPLCLFGTEAVKRPVRTFRSPFLCRGIVRAKYWDGKTIRAKAAWVPESKWGWVWVETWAGDGCQGRLHTESEGDQVSRVIGWLLLKDSLFTDDLSCLWIFLVYRNLKCTKSHQRGTNIEEETL